MIKICERLNIVNYSFEELNMALDVCEKCKWYYSCNEALELNDKLKEVEV